MTQFQKRVVDFLEMLLFFNKHPLTDSENELAKGAKYEELFRSLEARGVKLPIE